MLEKFIRGKEYQSVKYEEARAILELRFGIVSIRSKVHLSLYV